MRPLVKLLTLWSGRLPRWMPLFEHRIRANRLVDWQLIQFSDVRPVISAASLVTGLPCCKSTFYGASCDLRPLFGRMFADEFRGYPWWGWCDVDIVTGDLDGILVPLLDSYDIVAAAMDHSTCISGPLTVLRNEPEVLDLFWRHPRIDEMLADDAYWNFDEGGKNGNFTSVVDDSGLRVLYDRRTWNEALDMVGGG